MRKNHNFYLNLAFNIAKTGLGKTKTNPSVGCVIVKNGSVISSAVTSLNGRPHAEFNALNKKTNFKKSDLYVTMEPCTHHGVTPPCTNIIKKKGIKRVFYAFDDHDTRTLKKAKKLLQKKGIITKKINLKNHKNFYKSYNYLHSKGIPFIDAKIALSEDFLSIKKSSRWITNSLSRKRAHLLRSEYDCIISTSKTINEDNAQLNCRINGLNSNKPDLFIIDINLKIKKKLKIFNVKSSRKIFLITSKLDHKKIKYLKDRGIKIIYIKNLVSKNDFIILLKKIKKLSYNRILIESGLNFLKSCMTHKILQNLYLFHSNKSLKKDGFNNTSVNFLKKLKYYYNKINVNLNEDNLYKVRLK